MTLILTDQENSGADEEEIFAADLRRSARIKSLGRE
jgi:hypothetical protein